MGIKNLLKELKPAINTSFHLSQLPNGTIAAVDGNGWLHKACYAASTELALGKHKEASAIYLRWITRRIELFNFHHVRLIICFDGRRPSLKKETGDTRTETREEHLRLGKQLWQRSLQYPPNSPDRMRLKKEAQDRFSKAVRVKFRPIVTNVLSFLR